MPCAAACSAKAETPSASPLRLPASQVLKLTVITSARLFSMMYTSDKSIPSVVLVDAETTRSTVALGATAPDQVESRVASSSSPPPKSPGSGPSRTTVKLPQQTPKAFEERKSPTSSPPLNKLLRPITPIVTPLPVGPAL